MEPRIHFSQVGRGAFEAMLGIEIRPDGFVAWRAIDATTLSAASLESVLNRILCRSTPAVNRA